MDALIVEERNFGPRRVCCNAHLTCLVLAAMADVGGPDISFASAPVNAAPGLAAGWPIPAGWGGLKIGRAPARARPVQDSPTIVDLEGEGHRQHAAEQKNERTTVVNVNLACVGEVIQ
jgi:hypothetical protein